MDFLFQVSNFILQSTDIYNTIVERYKDGENVDKIIEDVLNDEKNFCTDGFYTEIYWTAFAYSLWKIGHLLEDMENRAFT